jgi:Spy/CpxP family protein refolding chaperone|tara:strand:+ start:511 stop:1014 length:504 start_codon:yes stop_codon:yes gene_type:complete
MNKTVIIIIILMCSNLFAQPGKSKGPGGQYSERMEMMLIWKLTDELELTEDQAQTFFPLMRSHQKEIMELRREEKVLFQPMSEKIKRDEKVDQSEVNSLLKEIAKMDDKKTKHRVKFIKKSSEVLEPSQQLRLLMFEPRMKSQVQKDIREKYISPKRGGNKKRRRPF